jgi:hypothetical protein
MSGEARRILAQPGFWIALTTLLVNDHVFKPLASQRLLPGLFTGKLSDIAGLAFAPALAWVVARVMFRSQSCAWLAFLGVPLVFTALNVSTRFCSAWMSSLAWLGIEQVVWSDPYDLLALPAVGLSYRWVRLSKCRQRAAASRWVALVGVGLGGFACLATSTPWSPTTIPAPALRNAPGEDLSIAIQEALAPVACQWGSARVMQHLNLGDFAALRLAILSDGEYATLGEAQGNRKDGDAGDTGEGGADSHEGAECGAAVIVAAGLAPTIVHWDLREVSNPPDLDAAEKVAPGTVYLEQFGSELHLALGDGMSVTKLEAPR